MTIINYLTRKELIMNNIRVKEVSHETEDILNRNHYSNRFGFQ
jgi:hypothetical protein